jgi:hypothetical protein
VRVHKIYTFFNERFLVFHETEDLKSFMGIVMSGIDTKTYLSIGWTTSFHLLFFIQYFCLPFSLSTNENLVYIKIVLIKIHPNQTKTGNTKFVNISCAS